MDVDGNPVTLAQFKGKVVILDFWATVMTPGEPTAGSDAADVRWFTRDELPDLNLANDTHEVVLKGLARA